MLGPMTRKLACSGEALKLAVAGVVQCENHLASLDYAQHISDAMALRIERTILHELEPIVRSICEVMKQLIDALHVSATR